MPHIGEVALLYRFCYPPERACRLLCDDKLSEWTFQSVLKLQILKLVTFLKFSSSNIFINYNFHMMDNFIFHTLLKTEPQFFIVSQINNFCSPC